MHKNAVEVQAASQMSTNGKNHAFTQLKRKGIAKYNSCHAGLQDGEILRERQTSFPCTVVACGKCSGVFSKAYFWKHKRVCCSTQAGVAKATDMKIIQNSLKHGNSLTEDFQTTIVQKFSDDEAGNLCKTNNCLLMIGQKLYDKLHAKQDKKMELKRSVMSDMRRLSTLFSHFQRKMQATGTHIVDFVDMYDRRNFLQLEAAIRHYTASDNESNMKAGLKLSLYYLIKRTAKIVKIMYLIKDDDDKASAVDKFIDLFTDNYNLLFSDAVYHINKNRQQKLRRPQELPQDEEVAKLRKYTVGRIRDLVGDAYIQWTAHEYAELRNLVVSRLTLFNARRGDEPSRLRVSHWTDACNGVWIDQSRVEKLSETEQTLFTNNKIMYETCSCDCS